MITVLSTGKTFTVQGRAAFRGDRLFEIDFEYDHGTSSLFVDDVSDDSQASVFTSERVDTIDLSGLKNSGAEIDGGSNMLLKTITGSAYNDDIYLPATTVLAGDGDDRVYGGFGAIAYWLDGGRGHDELYGGDGANTYVVDSRYDKVFEDYGGGDDRILAAVSYTLPTRVYELDLTGSRDNDGTGSGWNNLLVGNAGANHLSGQAGDDVLIGGAGQDVLTGGSGRDLFRFDSIADFNGSKGDRCDVVTDFQRGDRIDVSRIDALPGGHDSAFRFIGEAAFDGRGGELRTFVHGGDTFLQADLDGDRKVDFELRLTGEHALTAADFVL